MTPAGGRKGVRGRDGVSEGGRNGVRDGGVDVGIEELSKSSFWHSLCLLMSSCLVQHSHESLSLRNDDL